MSHLIHAYYLVCHGDDPVVVRSEADVDALVDAIGAADQADRMAALYLVDRPLNAAGLPDHELNLGVDIARCVGVLIYFNETGSAYSLGSPSEEGEVCYAFMGTGHECPANSEMPLDDVRRAVKEFMATGERPTSITWQPDPYYVPVPDESPYF